MVRSRRVIRNDTSVSGRCQFSDENAYRVRNSMPSSPAARTVSRTAFTP